MLRFLHSRLCSTYKHATQSAQGLEQRNFTRQQADQIITTIERHAASHRDVADAVANLTQAMKSAVDNGVAEGKRYVRTWATRTVGGCTFGVAALEYFDLKLVSV